jgi:hypothetical protein
MLTPAQMPYVLLLSVLVVLFGLLAPLGDSGERTELQPRSQH